MSAAMWAVVGAVLALTVFGFLGYGAYRIRRPFIPDGPPSKDDERPARAVAPRLAIEAGRR